MTARGNGLRQRLANSHVAHNYTRILLDQERERNRAPMQFLLQDSHNGKRWRTIQDHGLRTYPSADFPRDENRCFILTIPDPATIVVKVKGGPVRRFLRFICRVVPDDGCPF